MDFVIVEKKRASVAATIASAARVVHPAFQRDAIPFSGIAAQNTPSAPVFAKMRPGCRLHQPRASALGARDVEGFGHGRRRSDASSPAPRSVHETDSAAHPAKP